MLSINTNLSSLIAQRSMNESTNKLNQAIERMTTGYKINHSKDNAANYSIATNMTTKIGSYNVAEDNCAMGLDLISTAESSLNTISNKLSRLRTLAIQSQNGTYGSKSLDAINTEANSIVSEIKREYSTVEYNGLKLFNVEKEENSESFSNLEKVSEAATLDAGKSYRIDDVADLIMLQDFVNGGGATYNITFELTKDINMDGVEFRGIGNNYNCRFKGNFNGNGHSIKNLKIDSTENYVGLFGATADACIIDLGLTNCKFYGSVYIGGLIGDAENSKIKNCKVTESELSGIACVGGLIGSADDSTSIQDSYTKVNVTTTNGNAGGFIGRIDNSTIERCFSIGEVSGIANNLGGFIGEVSSTAVTKCFSNVTTRNISTTAGSDATGGFVGDSYWSQFNDCYSLGNVEVIKMTAAGGFLGWDNSNSVEGSNNAFKNDAFSKAVGKGTFSGITAKTEDDIKVTYTPEFMGFTKENGWVMVNGTPRLIWEDEAQAVLNSGNTVNLDGANVVSFQVGVNADYSSSMSFDLAFSLLEIDDVMALGLTDSSVLTLIDSMLTRIADKSIEYGSMQNRLESALDEIIISRENLISSRSTLRDADIADVSSTYIQQQILQQASATLMSTANQSPSIALQLI